MISQNLGQLLSSSAKKYPKRIAVVFGRKKITYKTLDETTSRIAAGLRHLGIKQGSRAAIFLDNCPEFIISYFSILKAGGTVVPINYMFKTEETRFILEDSRAETIITSRPYVDMAQDLRLRVDTLKNIICTGSCSKPHIHDFSRIKKDDHSGLKSVFTDSRDIAVILYTSGTTGHPKGAMLSHANLIVNADDCARNFKLDCSGSIMCILPLFHAFAATVCMNLPLSVGAKIVVMKSIKPFKRVIRAIRKNRVSLFVGVPSMYTLLKNIKLPFIFNSPLIKLFNPVKFCISGAASLPVETFKAFERKFRIPLIEGYGLTEASPVVTLNPVRGQRKAGSIGLSLAEHVELRVVNEKDEVLGPGKIGELLVKGPSVMSGYLNQPEASKETLKNGWLYTGDMVKMDKDGYVYIAGRKKEMVNVRGMNVYPREIEEVLYQNPKIKEAAVVGMPDEHKGEVPKGFVVLKDDAAATEREIILFLRDHLAAYKIPKSIEFRKSLPKNSAGKILKLLLKNEQKNNTQ
jgi:long-chain acyl-CoA synthetase